MFYYTLWIKNASESDPCSYEVTKAVAKKAQKKFWGFNKIWTHDLCDTGAMLYQLSYETLQNLLLSVGALTYYLTIIHQRWILANI